MAGTDFFTGITKTLEAVTGVIGGTASTVSSAISTGFSFLDKSPVVDKLAKAAGASMFATEEQIQPPRIRDFPKQDYELGSTVPSNIGIIQHPRLNLAVRNLTSRNINLGKDTQKTVDMSSAFVRPTTRGGTPMPIPKSTIKTTVKPSTTTTRKV